MKRRIIIFLCLITITMVLALLIYYNIGDRDGSGNKPADSAEQIGASSFSLKTENGSTIVSYDHIPNEVIEGLEDYLSDAGYDVGKMYFRFLNTRSPEALKKEYLYPYNPDIKSASADYYAECAFYIEPKESEWKYVFCGYIGLSAAGTVVEKVLTDLTKAKLSDLKLNYEVNDLRNIALEFSEIENKETLLVHCKPYLFEDETNIKLLYYAVLADTDSTAVIVDNDSGKCLFSTNLYDFNNLYSNLHSSNSQTG